MNQKRKYIKKYICFRFIPLFVTVGILSFLVVWMTKTNNDQTELVLSIAIASIVLELVLGYYLINIVKFSNMIALQEKKYKIKFEPNTPIVLAKHSSWIICSDNWLFSPGKFAIYIKEIKAVSFGEVYHEYKTGVIYPIKIKTISLNTIKVKFKSIEDAKYVKKWARK